MTTPGRQLRRPGAQRGALLALLCMIAAGASQAGDRSFVMPRPGGGRESCAVYARLEPRNLGDVCWRYLPHRGDFGGKGVALELPDGTIRIGFLGRSTVAHHADALPSLGGQALAGLTARALAHVAGYQFQALDGRIVAMQWDSRVTRRQTRERIAIEPETIARLDRAILAAIDPRLFSPTFAGIDTYYLEKTSDPAHPIVLATKRATKRATKPAGPGAPSSAREGLFLELYASCELTPASHATPRAYPLAPPLDELLVRCTGAQIGRLLQHDLVAWIAAERGIPASSFLPEAGGIEVARRHPGRFALTATGVSTAPGPGALRELWSQLRAGETELSNEEWTALSDFAARLPLRASRAGLPGIESCAASAGPEALSRLRNLLAARMDFARGPLDGWLARLRQESTAAARLRKVTTRALAWLDVEGRGPVFRPALTAGGREAPIVASSDGTLRVPAGLIPDSDDPAHPLSIELTRRLVWELAPFFGPFQPGRAGLLDRARRVLDRLGVEPPPEGLDRWLLESNPPERGLALVRLTLDPAYDEFPAVSPDGHSLAFCRLLPSPGPGLVRKGIFVQDLRSGRVTPIDTGDGSAMQPAWSPDGRWLAFRGENIENRGKTAGRARGDFDIRVVPSRGGAVRRLTSSPAEEKHPQFSPDGRRIAFYANRETPNHQLFVMDADGSHLTRLTSGSGDHKHPSWSADGTRILFHANGRTGEGGKPLWDIYSIRADGSDHRRLTETEEGDRHPFASSDGRWLAFHTNRGQLRILPLANDRPAGPIQAPSEEANAYFRDPFWIPGAPRLVLMRVFDKTRASLYALDLSARVGPPGAIDR